MSRPISRVLFFNVEIKEMVIHLAQILLFESSNLPAPQAMRKTSQSLFSLAPDGVYKLFSFH